MLRSVRRRAAVSAAAAAAGLVLLGACGTAGTGAAAGVPSAASVASTPSAPSSEAHGPAGTAAPASPPPSAGQPGAVRPPSVSPARHVTRPLALPGAGAASTGGEVTGVVSLGQRRCLFLTTDAGQRFEIAGALTQELRAVLAAGTGAALTASTASPPRAVPLPGLRVRVAAVGTVSTAASICSARYLFTARSGSVQAPPGVHPDTVAVASEAAGAPAN